MAHLDRATQDLIRASKSPHTLRAYESALRGFDLWRQERRPTDALVAAYLGHLHAAGKSPATAASTVAALRFRSEWTGQPEPVGKLAAAALAPLSTPARTSSNASSAPVSSGRPTGP